jgi:hypothetical protein
MPVRFLIKDNNAVMYSLHITDDGEIGVWTPRGECPDYETMLAAEALGFYPEFTQDLNKTWEIIKTSLHKEQELEDLLESVRSHNTTQRRSSYHYPYTISEFHYEMTVSDFASYLGTALVQRLKKHNGDAECIAELIAALRYEDGSGLEFDIENGRWHEATNWRDPVRAWSCIDRSVMVDGEELFEYCTDYESEIWDPVLFQSDVDADREPGMDDIATSYELPKVLAKFGLTDKAQQLHKEAVKEAPEPNKPAEPDQDGEWGVYYFYKKYVYDPKTDQWFNEWHEVVVPYYDLDDAQRAYELSKTIIEEHESQDQYPEYAIVHRASPGWTAKQRFLRKQLTMFDDYLMPSKDPALVYKDPALDIWRPWDEEEDEDEDEDEDEEWEHHD